MQDNYEWYTMVPHKSWSGDTIKLKVSIKMERPQNVKKGGYIISFLLLLLSFSLSRNVVVESPIAEMDV